MLIIWDRAGDGLEMGISHQFIPFHLASNVHYRYLVEDAQSHSKRNYTHQWAHGAGSDDGATYRDLPHSQDSGWIGVGAALGVPETLSAAQWSARTSFPMRLDLRYFSAMGGPSLNNRTCRHTLMCGNIFARQMPAWT